MDDKADGTFKLFDVDYYSILSVEILELGCTQWAGQFITAYPNNSNSLEAPFTKEYTRGFKYSTSYLFHVPLL